MKSAQFVRSAKVDNDPLPYFAENYCCLITQQHTVIKQRTPKFVVYTTHSQLLSYNFEK